MCHQASSPKESGCNFMRARRAGSHTTSASHCHTSNTWRVTCDPRVHARPWTCVPPSCTCARIAAGGASLVHMRVYRSRGGVTRTSPMRLPLQRMRRRVSQQGGRHEDLADEATFSAHAQRSWQGLTDGLRDSTAI
jgi:hypothetical protein